MEDLIDRDTLQQFQDHLSAVTGLAAVIVDPEGNSITRPSRFCRLCRDIIREKEEGRQFCRNLFLSMRDHEDESPLVGVCPRSGLIYSYVRIRLEGRTIATLVAGQVREKGRASPRTLAGPGEKDYDFQQALPDVPEMTLNHLKDITRFIDMIVHHFIDTADQNRKQLDRMALLDRMNECLQIENMLYRQSLMSAGEGILLLDVERHVVFLNSAAEEIIGWKQEELKGRTVDDTLIGLEDRALEWNERPRTGIFQPAFLRTRTGGQKAVTYCIASVSQRAGRPVGAVIYLRDPMAIRTDPDEIIYLSNHDELTGLYNRRYFETQLRQLDEPNCFPLSILMGDVNGLKFTNDVFGHFAGDHLLFLVSEAMKKHCRADQVIARWGGDEFVVLMPNTGEREASGIARRIMQECRQYDADKLTVSISFGCAAKTGADRKLTDILLKAEDQMYQKKMADRLAFQTAAMGKIEKKLFGTGYESIEQVQMLRELCHRVAPYFHLSEREVGQLDLLARMHDYGEIAVNSYILEKPSRLTRSEWKEVRKHPEIGDRILRTVSGHLEVGELILSHHESWNGGGYPMGLSGMDIPLPARIFSVIDAYTAMIHDRPYRKALTHEEAVRNLVAESGIRFDPQVVDAFLKTADRPDAVPE